MTVTTEVVVGYICSTVVCMLVNLWRLWPVCPISSQDDTNPQAPASGSSTKFDQVQSQVNEVKVILKDNIDKVMDRGDKLDDLIGKTDDLQASVSIWSWWHDSLSTLFMT